jgi:virginiamycin A acetyltransferase
MTTAKEDYQFAHPGMDENVTEEQLKQWETSGPTAETTYPFPKVANKIAFLKNVIKNPNIIVGDYTYYHDADGADQFEKNNVLYHEEIIGDKLQIAKFCQIAMGTQFIMNASSHQMSGFSTYPFAVFNENWAKSYQVNFPYFGDTIVGNDVWIGYRATIYPGVKIGDGAIIGTRALVTKDVEPYTIVGGNPAKVIRKRFSDEVIKDLLTIQWWNWPIDTVLQNLDAITGADIDRLKAVCMNKECS